MVIGEPGSLLDWNRDHKGPLLAGDWSVSAQLLPGGQVTWTFTIQEVGRGRCFDDPTPISRARWLLISRAGGVVQIRKTLRTKHHRAITSLRYLLEETIGPLGSLLAYELLEVMGDIARELRPDHTWERRFVRFNEVDCHLRVILALSKLLPRAIRPRLVQVLRASEKNWRMNSDDPVPAALIRRIRRYEADAKYRRNVTRPWRGSPRPAMGITWAGSETGRVGIARTRADAIALELLLIERGWCFDGSHTVETDTDHYCQLSFVRDDPGGQATLALRYDPLEGEPRWRWQYFTHEDDDPRLPWLPYQRPSRSWMPGSHTWHKQASHSHPGHRVVQRPVFV